jgi:sugar phosphate isomerase/epimerase
MKRRDFVIGGSALPLAAAATAPSSRPTLCFFSKHLQDLNYDQLGKTLHDIGFAGVDLTVRPQGHVLPERAEEDLPRAYETIRSHGIAVPMISTGLISASDPAARPILKTASRLGIPYFKLGYYRWSDDVGGTIAKVKSSLRGLLELAKEYGISAGFHNHVGYVGQSVWETQLMIEAMDPKRIGYYYDFHHAVVLGARNSWEVTLRLASARLQMVATKDFNWAKTSEGWQSESCPLGEGAVGWPKAFSMLAGFKFAGPLSIHQEYKSADRLAAARKDLEYVTRQISKAYA